MPSLNDAVRAIEAHIGFPASRTRQVARRLQEAGLAPSGAPGVAPVVELDDVMSLVLAVAADTTLHATADAVRQYRALVPGGADLADAPASIPRTAGDALDILADWAVRGDADLLRPDRFEVVSSWPEIALHDGGSVTRFVPAGASPTHWQARGHRRSTTIQGSAFVDCIRELFPENPHVA